MSLITLMTCQNTKRFFYVHQEDFQPTPADVWNKRGDVHRFNVSFRGIICIYNIVEHILGNRDCNILQSVWIKIDVFTICVTT